MVTLEYKVIYDRRFFKRLTIEVYNLESKKLKNVEQKIAPHKRNRKKLCLMGVQSWPLHTAIGSSRPRTSPRPHAWSIMWIILSQNQEIEFKVEILSAFYLPCAFETKENNLLGKLIVRQSITVMLVSDLTGLNSVGSFLHTNNNIFFLFSIFKSTKTEGQT